MGSGRQKPPPRQHAPSRQGASYSSRRIRLNLREEVSQLIRPCPMCPTAPAKLFFCLLTSPPEWSDRKIFWAAKSKTTMSWAQQREQIRGAARAGVRSRTSGLGSQILAGRAGNPPSSKNQRVTQCSLSMSGLDRGWRRRCRGSPFQP